MSDHWKCTNCTFAIDQSTPDKLKLLEHSRCNYTDLLIAICIAKICIPVQETLQLKPLKDIHP